MYSTTWKALIWPLQLYTLDLNDYRWESQMSTSRLDFYSNWWHLHAGKFTLAQNQVCLTLFKAPLEQLFEWYHELFCSLCCFSLVHALNNTTVQFFYHVVDSMWSFFSLLFLLLCALDTPLGNQALFSTTLFTLIVLLPSRGMSLEPPKLSGIPLLSNFDPSTVLGLPLV